MAGNSMRVTKQRLVKAVSLIALLDNRRNNSNNPHLGSNIERMLIDRELKELENEIIRNPGPLAKLIATTSARRRAASRS